MSEGNSGKDPSTLKTPMVYICGGKETSIHSLICTFHSPMFFRMSPGK